MQLLKEREFIEDPYGNTLFDDPNEYSSFYYKEGPNTYVGSLKIECSESILNLILDSYYKGLFKEELVTEYYTLSKGNDNGLFWHQMIGDSRIDKHGYLITEILYSDSMEKRIEGYFIRDGKDLSLKPYGFSKNINYNEIRDFYEISHIKKLKILLGWEECPNTSLIETWKKEPIEAYLEEIKTMIKEGL